MRFVTSILFTRPQPSGRAVTPSPHPSLPFRKPHTLSAFHMYFPSSPPSLAFQAHSHSSHGHVPRATYTPRVMYGTLSPHAVPRRMTTSVTSSVEPTRTAASASVAATLFRSVPGPTVDSSSTWVVEHTRATHGLRQMSLYFVGVKARFRPVQGPRWISPPLGVVWGGSVGISAVLRGQAACQAFRAALRPKRMRPGDAGEAGREGSAAHSASMPLACARAMLPIRTTPPCAAADPCTHTSARIPLHKGRTCTAPTRHHTTPTHTH